MIIGASMATIGYYSNDFALGEFRHNSTVRIKSEQRGLHLNNLSYLGPIIMGVGGESCKQFAAIYYSHFYGSTVHTLVVARFTFSAPESEKFPSV